MRWSIEELFVYWKVYQQKHFISWFKYFFKNTWCRFKLVIHWIFKGYCYQSMWDLDMYLAKIILFRLKKFLKSSRIGHPLIIGDDGNIREDSEDAWENILKTMIDKFEKMVTRSIDMDNSLENAPLLQYKNDCEALELFKEHFRYLWN